MVRQRVEPVIDNGVRGLCCKPYPGHPKGCPNWRKKEGCPPAAPPLADVLDLQQPVYAVWNVFDLGAHVERMRARHPDWSWRQLVNCLYWQGTARKQLREQLSEFFLWPRLGTFVLTCPEAHGVDVTATMAAIGIELQWPPTTTTHQVALVGTPIKGG